MADSEGRTPVPQYRFEEAVLAVVGVVLRTERRIDLAVDDTLAEGPFLREDPNLRADLILCAADCLRLMAALPGGRSRGERDFPAVAAACRSATVTEADDLGATRIQRALRRFNAGLATFRRR